MSSHASVRHTIYRKIILAGFLLALLGISFGNGFLAQTTKAVSSSGTVYGWGWNGYGGLGNGSTVTETNTPVMANLPSGVSATAIAGGGGQSLAIGSDNKLYAWGWNNYGQLGNGTFTNTSLPVLVNLPAGVSPIAIAAGVNHNLAIGSDNKLYAWGANDYGQIGNGSTVTSTNIPVVVSLPAGVIPTAISAGEWHSLAIGSDGKLYAWGNNHEGELGTGNITNSNIPVVVQLPAGVTPGSITAGPNHSLATGSDGKLYAWGWNANGQLGNTSVTGGESTIPVVVQLPTGVLATAITAAGWQDSMAIGSDGNLYTWGGNDYGQLGNGSATSTTVPITITLASGVTPSAIASGMFHSIAIGSDGKLYSWGHNDYDQLGTSTNITQSNSPIVTNIPNGLTPIALAAGVQHTLVILPTAPNLSINNVAQPEGNSGTTNFNFTVSLSYSSTQTVTVNYATSDGTATAPSDYTATNGTLTFAPGITTQTVSVPVVGDTAVEASETFTVTLSNPTGATVTTSQGVGAILNDDQAPVSGLVYDWGSNDSKQLGNFTITATKSTLPVIVNPPTGLSVTAVAGSRWHSLAIGSDGKLYAWGDITYDPQGGSTATNTDTPVAVDLPAGVTPTNIAAGVGHNLAVGSDGKLYAWGDNTYDQLGNGSTITGTATPVVVSLPTGVSPTAIAAGSAHNLVIGSDNKLYAWGNNLYGQLGNGTNISSTTPIVINLPNGATPVAIKAGLFHSMAIGSDGKLYAWGYNNAGQLGNGTTGTNSSIPVLVNLPAGVVATNISGGGYFSLAYGSDGKFYAWGDNGYGEYGNGTTTSSSTPVAVSSLSGMTPSTIATGWFYSMAIGQDGKLYSWGYNNEGELGNGSTTFRNTPGLVSLPIGVNPKAIAAGIVHGLAILPPTPNVSINNVSQAEGNSGTTNFNFTLSLSFTTTQTVTVSYATSNGTAIAPTDYISSTGIITFAPGTVSQNLTIAVNGDTNTEPIETFSVNLSNPAYAFLTTTQGVGTILNDDFNVAGLVYDWGRGDSGQIGNGTTNNINLTPTMATLPNGVSPTAIAAGAYYGMATGNNGILYAWGLNSSGQLGNGTLTNTSTPVIVNLPAGVSATAIEAGDTHSLAIGNNGTLYAWGLNANGQLGNGTTINSATPVTVSLPAGVTPVAIEAGDNHSLAIGSDGKLYAWGANAYGELGNSTTTQSSTPVVVNLPGGVSPTAIAAGGEFSMAIGNNGKLYAWGRNSNGQLGNNTSTDNPNATPIVITLASGVSATKIDVGGNHSLAIGSDGKLYTWGADAYGQVCATLTLPPSRSNPVAVTLPAGVTPVAIAAGGEFTLITGNNGKLYGCGRSDYGQLGTGSTGNLASPGIINLPDGFTLSSVAVGDYLSMAILSLPSLSINNVSQAEGNSGTTNVTFTVTLAYAGTQTVTVNYATSDGTATAPGDYTGTSGTLTFSPGITIQTVTVPVIGDIQAEPDETFAVTLSNATNAAILTAQGIGTIVNDDAAPVSGAVYGWGDNYYGTIGNGTYTNSNTPTMAHLPNGVSASAIAEGGAHSLAIGNDNKLYAWGNNQGGQLGNGSTITQTSTPVIVSLPNGVIPTAIVAGDAHSLAIGSDSKLYAWGVNSYGQLGNGTIATSTNVPVVVQLPAGVIPITITVGNYHSLAIGSDGKLYAWGRGDYGQLGNGTFTNTNTPAVVNLPAGVIPTGIAAGFGHSLASGNDGKLYAWGSNSQGQLGTSSASTSTPVVVNLPAGVSATAVTAGYSHSMAIGSDGKLYTWGSNNEWQLGNNSNTDSNTPIAITLASGVTPTAIAAGQLHSLALGSDGKLYGWGYNFQGEVGNGTNIGVIKTPVVTSFPTGIIPIAISTAEGQNMAIAPAAPNLSINNVSQAEGNSGTTNFTFTVTLAYAGTQTVTVNYATSDGTATAPSDYTSTSGTLTFSPGITTQTVTVPVVGDTLVEANETFTVTLASPAYAFLGTSQGIGTIVNDDTVISTTTTLTSSPNPSAVGQIVTFTATVSPTAASGTVTFTEGATVLGTASVVSGTAIFTTSNLITGSHVIRATYSGDATYAPSTSNTVTQVVSAACAPLVVTANTDDGTGITCGTFSYALSQPITGSTPVTITFALTQGNTITFTGSFTTTAKAKVGVTIYGGAFGSTNRIILNGNGVAGNGLDLLGHNYLVNLTIEHFGGKELVLEGTGNRMQGVVVIAS